MQFGANDCRFLKEVRQAALDAERANACLTITFKPGFVAQGIDPQVGKATGDQCHPH